MKMNKLLFLIFFLSSFKLFAYDFEVGGLYYNVLTDSTAELTYENSGGATYSGNIQIPDTVPYNNTNYTVTAIGQMAFFLSFQLTGITIPKTVRTIGNFAFFSSGLTEIDLPASIEYVGNQAFRNTPISRVSIGNEHMKIDSDIFSATPWKENLPDGLTYIGSYAYLYKGTMPENTSITLKEGTTHIGEGCFNGCSNLVSITLPESVENIGNMAFMQCVGLKSIHFPSSLREISYGAFYDCISLQNIEIPASIKELGSVAFIGCYSLESVVLPETLASIPDGIFQNCHNLKTINIPNSVATIGEQAFENCDSLNINLVSNSLKKIDNRAFFNCGNLTDITIPESVTSIGKQAFSYCDGLKTLTIKGKILKIEENTFWGCTALETLVIPSSVYMIYPNAFGWCRNLKSIRVEAEWPAYGEDCFEDVPKGIDVYVPAKSVDKYKSGYIWHDFNILPIEEVVQTIDTSVCEVLLYDTAHISKSDKYIFEYLEDNIAKDSFVVLNVNINHGFEIHTEKIIPFGTEYQFGTQQLSESGKYVETFISQAGCDSIVNLTFTVAEPNTLVNEISAIECGSFLFKSTNITQSGFYKDTLQTAKGVDSIVLLDLTVNPEYTLSLQDTAQFEVPYMLGNHTLHASGIYTETLTTSEGCDSTVTVDLYVPTKGYVYYEYSDTSCGRYIFGEKNVYTSGIYRDTIHVNENKDSVVTLHLTASWDRRGYIEETIPYGESYRFGSRIFTESGEYTEVLEGRFGCDSTITLYLTVLPDVEKFVTLHDTACGSYKYRGTIYTESTEIETVLQAKSGVDSTVTIKLVIYPEEEIWDEIIVEHGQTYQFGTQNLSASGEYTEIFTSQHGCDSIVHLKFIVLDSDISLSMAYDTVCGEYNYNNKTYKESGLYNLDTIINGNEKILNAVDLIVNPIYTINYGEYAVNYKESYQFGSQVLHKVGQYTETFISSKGCDSTVTIDFIINPINIQVYDTACGEYIFNGKTITESGNYVELFKTVEGGDSIVHLSLTVWSVYEETAEKTVSYGESYQFGKQNLTKNGVYTETFASVNGCDSTVTLNFSVLAQEYELKEINATSCGTYQFYNTIISESGIYRDTISGAPNSDTIVILNATILPIDTVYTTDSILLGDEYVFGDQILTKAGSYSNTLISANGCDSLVFLNLKVVEKKYITNVISEQLCKGMWFGDDFYGSSGVYNDTVHIDHFTDSIITLNLTVYFSYGIKEKVEIPYGSSYLFGERTLHESGTYVEDFKTIYGCDSVVTLTLIVLPEEPKITELFIDACDSYEFAGEILTVSGEYKDRLKAVSGTDSTIILHLTLHSSFNEELYDTIPEGTVYFLGNREIDESGTYTESFISKDGCDSVITLHLSVHQTIVNEIAIENCDSYEFNGQYLDHSGTYYDTISLSDIKDSVVVLSLVIHSSYTEHVDKIIPHGTSITFGSQILTKNGNYTETFTSVNGCDSTVILTLIVQENKPPYFTIEETHLELAYGILNGTEIFTVTANDPENAKITYSIGSGSEAFSIDSNTGTLTLNDKSSLIVGTTYNLEVAISDGDNVVSQLLEVTLLSGTAIDETSNSISMYPNYVDTELKIMANGSYGKIIVVSQDGNVVYKEMFKDNQIVDCQKFASGIYTVQVITNNQRENFIIVVK